MTSNRWILIMVTLAAVALVTKAWTERNYSLLKDKKPAPSLSVKSLTGNTLNLSDFKGSYVYLDFWASWCAPCRRENQNLVRVYHELQSKTYQNGLKLKVLSISIDTDTVAWRKAVRNDRLFWTEQGIDPMGWNSETVNQWDVQSIPAGFLIDPEGNIIAEKVKASQIDQIILEDLRH